MQVFDVLSVSILLEDIQS